MLLHSRQYKCIWDLTYLLCLIWDLTYLLCFIWYLTYYVSYGISHIYYVSYDTLHIMFDMGSHIFIMFHMIPYIFIMFHMLNWFKCVVLKHVLNHFDYSICYFPLQGKLGEILISMCYQPTVGRITMVIMKCRELKAKDITGTSGISNILFRRIHQWNITWEYKILLSHYKLW